MSIRCPATGLVGCPDDMCNGGYCIMTGEEPEYPCEICGEDTGLSSVVGICDRCLEAQGEDEA